MFCQHAPQAGTSGAVGRSFVDIDVLNLALVVLALLLLEPMGTDDYANVENSRTERDSSRAGCSARPFLSGRVLKPPAVRHGEFGKFGFPE